MLMIGNTFQKECFLIATLNFQHPNETILNNFSAIQLKYVHRIIILQYLKSKRKIGQEEVQHRRNVQE